MKIAIYFKKENTENAKLVEKEAKKYGFIIDNHDPDVVFSVGGDGTFLRAMHNYIDRLDKVLFVGINFGTLGFLYDFSKDDISKVMKNLADNKIDVKEQHLLKGEITYEFSKETVYALNEIRIENPFHTLISDVLVNGELLEKFRGNGLIISSTIGSSAYNKSLGGALIDHDIEALELTEVAGISNNIYRSLGSSLIIKGDKKVEFTGRISHSVVGYDHLSLNNDDNLMNVEISYSNKIVKIAYDPQRSYIQKIRKSFVL